MELPSFRHPLRTAFVFGPEHGSLSAELLERCRASLRVPLPLLAAMPTGTSPTSGKMGGHPGSHLIFFGRAERQGTPFTPAHSRNRAGGVAAEHAHRELRYLAPLYRVAPRCC